MKQAVVVALSLSLSACGTVLHRRSDALFVDSRPAGADATVMCDGGVRVNGTTPVKLVFPRRAAGCVLTVHRAGHESHRLELERRFSAGFWANFALVPGVGTLFLALDSERDLSFEAIGAGLVSGGIGFLVDHITGAKYDYDPEEVVVELKGAPPTP